jgi:mono/diheme cytochrome c family protein
VIVVGATAGTRATSVTINVTATDAALKLSARTAPVGWVTFVVKNTGKRDHSFSVAGKQTAVIKPGKRDALLIRFAKPGLYAYKSAVPGDAAAGLRGTFTAQVAAPEPNAAGKTVFTTGGCGVCHTLKAAGSTGMTGPNLDRSTAKQAAILQTVSNGKGTMPAFVDRLSPQQLEDVAAFVFQARTG